MALTHKLSDRKIQPHSTIEHIPLYTALIACESNGIQNSFHKVFVVVFLSIFFWFFFTKIVLFYNGSEFYLEILKKTNLNANAYKPQDENSDILTQLWSGFWHFFIQTS